MFGSIGGTELLLIMVLALIIFGPRKLPDLGRSIGKAMAEFRRASFDFRNTLEREIDVETRREVQDAAPADRFEVPPPGEKPAGPGQDPPKPTSE